MLPQEANDITRNPSAANIHRTVHSMRQIKHGDVLANNCHPNFRDPVTLINTTSLQTTFNELSHRTSHLY